MILNVSTNITRHQLYKKASYRFGEFTEISSY